MEAQRRSLVTVERAAYVAVALLAAGLRWSQLGLAPLGPGEAVQALSAYRFIHGGAAAAPPGTIPALFTANTVAFTLAGAGDAGARWLPALAGLLLVLLPYGLRHRLGRGGALAASFLLALSPSAVYFGRQVDGSILVATCGLALAVCLIRALDFRRTAALCGAAAALGVGLVSGRAIYSLLLVFLTFVLVLYLDERLRHPSGGWHAVQGVWTALPAEKHLAAKLGGILAGAFLVIGTTFVLHPAGIGNAADLLGDWVQGFRPEPGGQPFGYPFLLLVRYETLVLLLGLVEATYAAFQKTGSRSESGSVESCSAPMASEANPHAHTVLFVYWFLAALLLALIAGRRSTGDLLLAVVPLALLAGQSIERAWHWMRRWTVGREAIAVAGVALGLAVFFYLQITAFAISDDVSTVQIGKGVINVDIAYLLLALLAIVLLLVLVAVTWLWRGPNTLCAGGWLALTLVLGLWGFRSAWGVSHTHAADPREPLIAATTPADMRDFVQQIERLSLDTAGDAYTLPVTVAADTGPVVAWYMREFRRMQVVDGITGPPETSAVVTLAQQDMPIGETFRGESFPLRISASPWGLTGKRWVLWLLFTAGSLPAVEQEVVLWVSSP